MLRRPVRQRGFTLIEVSLAIVIGVVILAGGISLYNQTKLSAGNSKAQERVLALASLVEEMGASSINQAYPTLANLNTIWTQRRPDDARANPWGGVVADPTNAILIPVGGSATAAWVRATAGSAGTNITFITDSSGTAATTANEVNAQDKIGQLSYAYGPGGVSIYDPSSLGALKAKNFYVGCWNSRGDGVSFVAGGK
ncbi:MAG: type II secretion system protein [bacterium]|nr:type II secretion system protein [bacterium]